MTVLQALNGYYERRQACGNVSTADWSREKFGWCIVLSADGDIVDLEDLHDPSSNKRTVRLFEVPAAVRRTVGIAPNLLWDKTAYVLGRTKKASARTAREHAAFVDRHLKLLAGTEDAGLAALRRFLEEWTPERFDSAPFDADMLDGNVMFRLEGDGDEDGRLRYLHQRPEARALVAAHAADTPGEGGDVFCLVTGRRGNARRLHPTIKGVEGAQSSGAALVSFNLDAFTSYGKEQGANAPVSEEAADRYGKALNWLLERDSRNRVRRPVGDATVVFWAEASDPAVADALDEHWAAWSSMDDVTDEAEARKIAETLESVAAGRPVGGLDPHVVEGTRFYILGLSPNAARLSVRFWETGGFGDFARRLRDHYEDVRIEPRPIGWGVAPSVRRLLVRSVAAFEKFENIPKLLAGEVMRAILTGGRYPGSLLAAAIMRLRAGDDPLTGWHAAVIRAVLARDHRKGFQKEGVPMSLAPDEPNRAYQLGRLFAVLETAQRMALGNVNATIRDRYFGAASATPARIFPLLLRGAQNHLGKLRKEKKGYWLEREIENILSRLTLDLPQALPLTEQGRFAIGYYHQRKEQFKGRPDTAEDIQEGETE